MEVPSIGLDIVHILQGVRIFRPFQHLWVWILDWVHVEHVVVRINWTMFCFPISKINFSIILYVILLSMLICSIVIYIFTWPLLSLESDNNGGQLASAGRYTFFCWHFHKKNLPLARALFSRSAVRRRSGVRWIFFWKKIHSTGRRRPASFSRRCLTACTPVPAVSLPTASLAVAGIHIYLAQLWLFRTPFESNQQILTKNSQK